MKRKHEEDTTPSTDKPLSRATSSASNSQSNKTPNNNQVMDIEKPVDCNYISPAKFKELFPEFPGIEDPYTDDERRKFLLAELYENRPTILSAIVPSELNAIGSSEEHLEYCIPLYKIAYGEDAHKQQLKSDLQANDYWIFKEIVTYPAQDETLLLKLVNIYKQAFGEDSYKQELQNTLHADYDGGHNAFSCGEFNNSSRVNILEYLVTIYKEAFGEDSYKQELQIALQAKNHRTFVKATECPDDPKGDLEYVIHIYREAFGKDKYKQELQNALRADYWNSADEDYNGGNAFLRSYNHSCRDILEYIVNIIYKEAFGEDKYKQELQIDLQANNHASFINALNNYGLDEFKFVISMYKETFGEYEYKQELQNALKTFNSSSSLGFCFYGYASPERLRNLPDFYKEVFGDDTYIQKLKDDLVSYGLSTFEHASKCGNINSIQALLNLNHQLSIDDNKFSDHFKQVLTDSSRDGPIPTALNSNNPLTARLLLAHVSRIDRDIDSTISLLNQILDACWSRPIINSFGTENRKTITNEIYATQHEWIQYGKDREKYSPEIDAVQKLCSSINGYDKETHLEAPNLLRVSKNGLHNAPNQFFSHLPEIRQKIFSYVIGEELAAKLELPEGKFALQITKQRLLNNKIPDSERYDEETKKTYIKWTPSMVMRECLKLNNNGGQRNIG
jgi:hypothetical protein